MTKREFLEATYTPGLATSAGRPGSGTKKRTEMSSKVYCFMCGKTKYSICFPPPSVLYMEVLTNTNAGRNEMHAYIFFLIYSNIVWL